MYTELEKILNRSLVKYDEPLKRHCTFKIGGPADVLVLPENAEQLKAVLVYARENGIYTCVIGNGSNVLFSDGGVRGIVIKISSGFGNIDIESRSGEGAVIKAGAGALLSRVSAYACAHSLTGLEFAHGIPGSVGGAVLMNAGAYDGEISQCVFRSTYIDTQSYEIHVKENSEHMFSYRNSSYQKENAVIISGYFTLKYGEQSAISAKMKELMMRRASKQPLDYPSAGSAFKRPTGNYAAKLIDECGLRGYSCGGAAVSEKHSGFIINKGGASCCDVLHVIEYVQETVLRRTGIHLEPEIKVIGECI